MTRTEYKLTIMDNGDIFIFKNNGPIYHKTYDLGDNLMYNLFKAYELWDRLTSEEIESKIYFKGEL